MSKHLKEVEIIPYLDARLNDAERQRLDRHLTDCSACRAKPRRSQNITLTSTSRGASVMSGSSSARASSTTGGKN